MTIETLYRQIPRMACRPACGDCCGIVPWSPEEFAKVKDRMPADAQVSEFRGSIIIIKPGSANCVFLAADAGCTVYEDRPFMCRLFGTAPEPRLTCPHGCRPTRQLTAEKASRLTGRYSREYVEHRKE